MDSKITLVAAAPTGTKDFNLTSIEGKKSIRVSTQVTSGMLADIMSVSHSVAKNSTSRSMLSFDVPYVDTNGISRKTRLYLVVERHNTATSAMTEEQLNLLNKFLATPTLVASFLNGEI